MLPKIVVHLELGIRLFDGKAELKSLEWIGFIINAVVVRAVCHAQQPIHVRIENMPPLKRRELIRVGEQGVRGKIEVVVASVNR
jgi:hypothetical protein